MKQIFLQTELPLRKVRTHFAHSTNDRGSREANFIPPLLNEMQTTGNR